MPGENKLKPWLKQRCRSLKVYYLNCLKNPVNLQTPLRKLPRIGEFQLPSGDGLPPPSQPFLDGFEPEIPATAYIPNEDEELNTVADSPKPQGEF